MKIISFLFISLSCLLQLACKPKGTSSERQKVIQLSSKYPEIVRDTTIISRFAPPKGFQRQKYASNSFAYYLRHLPLKVANSPVLYYDGREKYKQDVHAAVIEMDVGKRDLQQCADAIMRLRGEYLYQNKHYDAIQFHYTNGFLNTFSKWGEGYRPQIKGNEVKWIKKGQVSYTYTTFRSFMTNVFIYSGTLSLEKELKPIDIKDIAIGDVFIQGGSPGHAVVVVDLCVNPSTQEKKFLLAQSYMPAQDIHILKNPNSAENTAWYSSNFGKTLYTPEWTFKATDLRRF